MEQLLIIVLCKKKQISLLELKISSGMDFWIYMTIVVCLGMILSIIFRSQRRSRNAATFTSKQTDKKFSLQSFNKKIFSASRCDLGPDTIGCKASSVSHRNANSVSTSWTTIDPSDINADALQ